MRVLAAVGRLRALGATLVMVLALAMGPAVEAAKHGPAALVAEAEHSAFHAGHGHLHDLAAGYHESGDHDHIATVLLAAAGAEFHPVPARTSRPEGVAADGMIRDGPRRPPRLTAV